MMTSRPALVAAALCLLAAAAVPPSASACHFASHYRLMEEEMGMRIPPRIQAILHRMEADLTQEAPVAEGSSACVDGLAGEYPCSQVDLMARLPTADIGGGSGNDVWGWTDPVTGHEWALMGRTNGTAFVDVTDPANPVYVANLPTAASSNTWRDMKVYADHAFIVGDFVGDHGMQVFDLNRLRDLRNPPVTLDPIDDLAAHYTEFDSAHNIVINEESGFAYVVGGSSGDETCNSGLHMIDIRVPAAPVFAGCFGADGYTHDAQCVSYHGPDPDHQGAEICFASNTDTLTIVDVTNKLAPVQLAREEYVGSGYTHQGWLTPDHRYFLVDDELDELDFLHNTRTYTWDVSDLDDPVLEGFFEANGPSIDHNQYVEDGYTFQANYRRGLRILRIVDPENAALEEAAFFDTYPTSDAPSFSGAWSTYPYFASGTVLVSDINRGLFVLRPRLAIFADGFESGDLAAWSQVVP